MRYVLVALALLAGCDGGLARAPELEPSASPRLELVARVPPPEVLEAQLGKPGLLPAAGQPHVLFVNFEGGPLHRTSGCQSATMDCSWLVECSTMVDFPRFSGAASRRDEIMVYVRRFFAPFDLEVVTTRPAAGTPYTMAMVGGRPEAICLSSSATGGTVAGVAPLDCANSAGDVEIVFAFSEVAANGGHAVAVTIAQEAAHAFGLEHTSAMNDIMYPYLSGSESGFLDMDMPVERGSGCVRGAQNSFALLTDTVGASPTLAPDVEAPSVRFLSPQDGLTGFDNHLRIRLSATDDRGVRKVDLVIDEGAPNEQRLSLAASPFDFEADLQGGDHHLKAVASDGAGNQGVATIAIGVDAKQPAGTSCMTSDICELECLHDGQAAFHCASPCSHTGTCANGGHVCVDYRRDGKLLCLPENLIAPTPIPTGPPAPGCAAAPGGAGESGVALVMLALFFATRRRRHH